MLFDERDLRVFDNPDSRQYFLKKFYNVTIVKIIGQLLFCYIHLLFMICL